MDQGAVAVQRLDRPEPPVGGEQVDVEPQPDGQGGAVRGPHGRARLRRHRHRVAGEFAAGRGVEDEHGFLLPGLPGDRRHREARPGRVEPQGERPAGQAANQFPRPPGDDAQLRQELGNRIVAALGELGRIPGAPNPLTGERTSASGYRFNPDRGGLNSAVAAGIQAHEANEAEDAIIQFNAHATAALPYLSALSLSVGFEQYLLQREAVGRQAAEVLDTYVYHQAILPQQWGIGAAAGLFKAVVGILLIVASNKLAHAFGEQGVYSKS